MRVLHLIKGLGLGGAENLLLEAARHRSAGEVTYSFAYFLPWKDALVGPLRDAGAEVLCFSARSRGAVLARAPSVAVHLHERGVDLVHCHLPLAGVAGRLAGRLAGVPVVYTEHNLMERYHPLTRRANLWTWRWQELVVAVSAQVADSIARHAGAAVPVRTIPNGVPVDRLLPDPEGAKEVRRELGIPADAPVVGQVAVFRRQKRLDLWLRAAVAIRRRHPDAHFLLVGDGPTRGEVEALSRELGLGGGRLEGPVHFTGLREEVRPFLSAMDLLMISSEFEGLPLVLLEAMAMGVPVVATSVGGIPQAVLDGETGRLVPPGDPGALAEAASALLDAGETRRAMGRAARRRASERFSSARMLTELEALYREVLHGGTEPGSHA